MKTRNLNLVILGALIVNLVGWVHADDREKVAYPDEIQPWKIEKVSLIEGIEGDPSNLAEEVIGREEALMKIAEGKQMSIVEYEGLWVANAHFSGEAVDSKLVLVKNNVSVVCLFYNHSESLVGEERKLFTYDYHGVISLFPGKPRVFAWGMKGEPFLTEEGVCLKGFFKGGVSKPSCSRRQMFTKFLNDAMIDIDVSEGREYPSVADARNVEEAWISFLRVVWGD